MSELPAPLTPADCDLRDFPFMPVDITRLFNSEFHARANDAEWRAGLTLWLKSFHQVPAGSVPDDDVSLTRLAELGRDVKAWRKVKEVALYGWVKCTDGRLYHPVVVEKVLEAWKGKGKQRGRTAKARLQAMVTRLSKATDDFDFAHVEGNIQTLLEELSQYLSQTEMESVKKSVTDSVTETKGKREGKGQGKGKDYSDPNGSGGEPPGGKGGTAKTPAEMAKRELWRAGKSILAQGGMPEDQCGTFVGMLCRDYGDDIVIEAVRETVKKQPAVPEEFLKAACMARKGEGGKMLIPWNAPDAVYLAKGLELVPPLAPNRGEHMIDFKARVIAALGGVKAPEAPPVPVAPLSPTVEPDKIDTSPEAVTARNAEIQRAREASAAATRAARERKTASA